MIPGEPPESNVLAGCHIISEPCLEVIARNKHVYDWSSDPTVLWDSALKGIKAGNITSLPGDMLKAVPFKKRGNSIGKCVWKFACNYHDNKVFKLIDTTDMDLASPEVQFLLGFRTVAATTTWSESHLHYFENSFFERTRMKRLLRDYPQARSLLEHLRPVVSRMQMGVNKLIGELDRWQEMYISAHSAADYSVMTCRRSTIPVISSAGAGVAEWSGQSAIIAVVLPRQSRGQTKAPCDIVVTSLRPKSWLARLFLRGRINLVAKNIQTMLSGDPIANFPSLENTLEFCYVSPDDFDNDAILDDRQRQEIHARIASQRSYDP